MLVDVVLVCTCCFIKKCSGFSWGGVWGKCFLILAGVAENN